jgi:hypothetical protein
VYLRTGTRVYHHWVLSWVFEKETLGCNIYTVTHDQPGHEDVLGYCGEDIYRQWYTGPLCVETAETAGQCRGLTLYDYGEIDERLKTTIRLPLPEVEIGIVNCQPWQNCRENPRIQFVGYEPLRNHRIESVQIEYADHTGLVCWRTDRCTVAMPQTNPIGTNVTVYVTSSYGDESEDLVFRLRNMPDADGTYLFQLLNTSFDNIAPPESVAWGIFPELDTTFVPWLDEITAPGELATQHDYAFLAGRYILRGDVDISSCIYGGVFSNGAATQCGIEQARELIYSVQNQSDDLILSAARRTRIPPRIIKGVIAQESQFWPHWYINGEYGLGMLTDEGMEMMLTWNPVAYLELCVPLYGEDICAAGYDELGKMFGNYPQDLLRGKAMEAIGTDEEFYRIAQTIVGAAAQSGRVVYNVTHKDPYEILSYQDMWKITLGVYNSGVGCMYHALAKTWDPEIGHLNWGGISENFIGDCQNAADYPADVLYNGVP